MKFIEKTTLVIFSCIMLILSVITCLLIFGWIEINMVQVVINNIIVNTTRSNIVLAISILFILLSIKCIFFDSGRSEKGSREGILLENEDGKLLISKDTLENLVSGVAKGFDSTENVNTRIQLDRENNLRVFVTLYVQPTAIIKELSANLQQKIKEAVKKATDLDIKEVTIKVRNIATPKQEEISE